MKATLSILSSLLSLTLASPLAAPQSTSDSPFGLIAARSASPIHMQAINANGTGFWIGKETAAYCPLTDKKLCPPGKETVFSGGGTGLNTEVPGGQQIYVTSSGALSFTEAHSGAIPKGASTGPFIVTPPGSNGLGTYKFTGLGATGFVACPADRAGKGPWKVFADVKEMKDSDVPGGCRDECLGFDALTVGYRGKGAAAWEYV